MAFIRTRNFLQNFRSQSEPAKSRPAARVWDVNALYLETAISKTLPLMPGSLNPPVGQPATIKSSKPEISMIRLTASSTKTASRLNSIAIWTLTGLSKRICLIMGLKNMPPSISTMASSWPPPWHQLRSTIPIISNIVRFSVVIPNTKSKKYMRTKVTPVNPTATSWLLTKSLTALWEKIQPPLNWPIMK